MVGLKLDLKNAGITEKSILKYSKEVEKIHTELHEKKDDENEFLGWLDLPSDYDKKEVEKIKSLDVKDIACIREELYIKEGDKLLRQAQSCDLYNGDIYLREGTELTKLGIKNWK